jgi:hypothetical protein
MPHCSRAALLLWLTLSGLSSCAGSPTGGNPPPGPPEPPVNPPPGPTVGNPPAIGAGARVLFIGNSLTEGNDLPGMVRDLAEAAGLDWDVQAQLRRGAGLEDHWVSGARERIASGHWDVVVLQQGPSSLEESRANLRHWTGEFDPLVRAAGGRSALYMVWPDRSRLSWFDRVRDSYALAARDVSGYFLPAGEAWRAAWRVTPGLVLYGGDDFHPSMAGTYTAALTIFAALSGKPTLGLPAPSAVDAVLAERLQRAALEALDDYADYGPEDAP